MRVPLPEHLRSQGTAPAAAPEPKAAVEGEDTFAALMRQYHNNEIELERAKALVSDLDSVRTNLRTLLRSEALNRSIGKGSNVRIDGVGVFGWTTQRSHVVPRERREEFARLLAGRDEYSLLTIGKRDLREWCEELGDKKPAYIEFHEDPFVPRIKLDRD